MLAWLSVWSEVEICVWSSWCHCHSLSLAPVNPGWFYLSILLHLCTFAARWDSCCAIYWHWMVTVFPTHLWSCDRNWRNRNSWYLSSSFFCITVMSFAIVVVWFGSVLVLICKITLRWAGLMGYSLQAGKLSDSLMWLMALTNGFTYLLMLPATQVNSACSRVCAVSTSQCSGMNRHTSWCTSPVSIVLSISWHMVEVCRNRDQRHPLGLCALGRTLHLLPCTLVIFVNISVSFKILISLFCFYLT